MITHGFKKAFQSCHASRVVSQRAASYSVFCLLRAEQDGIAMNVSTAKLLLYFVMEEKRREYQDVNEVYLENSFLVL